MTSPTDVAAFHAEYDIHPGDRVGLFGAVAGQLGVDRRVLYPGSYLTPKKKQAVSVESIRASGRGVAYTRSPFAYLFTRRS